MFRSFFRFSIIYSLLILATTLNPLSADSIPAQQMMTQQERESMGFDKLTPAEKGAFEQWAGKWTQAVLEQAPSYRPGQNLSQWVQGWPSFANPTKQQYSPEEIANRMASNQIIDRVRNDGEYIDLKDGSSWHISPFYRYLTTTWQKNQAVEVRKGSNDLHPWLLHNLSLGSVAEADMGNPPSPDGKRPSDSPDYYKGAIGMQNVTPQGDILTLADGTQWKIAPTDMYKVRNWKQSDRIRVETSENLLYKFRIMNLDTGEVSLANART